MYKGKKELFHAFRYLLFSIQIVETEKINDYSEANEIWFEHLKESQTKEWIYYENFYLEKFRNLIHLFRKKINLKSKKQIFYTFEEEKNFNLEYILDCKKEMEEKKKIDLIFTEKKNFFSEFDIKNLCKNKFKIVEFLRENGLKGLKNLKTLFHISKDENLICINSFQGKTYYKKLVLFYEKNEILPDHVYHEMREECKHGLILDLKNNFEVIAFSFFGVKNFFECLKKNDYDNKNNNNNKKNNNNDNDNDNNFLQIDENNDFISFPSSFVSSPIVDGFLVYLFYYLGEWRVASKCKQNKFFF